MSMERRAVVFGATGTQGQAAARALLAESWLVTAVTRDPESERAKLLVGSGARTVLPPVDDAGLARLLDGATCVVSVQPALTDRWNADEAIAGIRIATAARQAGVPHFIQQSAMIAEARGVLGMGSKRAIEERIAELELPTTILRPAFFMENLLNYFPLRSSGVGLVLAAPLPADRPIELVAAADIGRAVAAVARDPQAHIGRAHDLIGDRLTFSEMAQAVEGATGRPVTAQPIPPEALAEGWPQGVPLFRWIVAQGTSGSGEALRALVGPPISFADWVGASLAPVLPAVAA